MIEIKKTEWEESYGKNDNFMYYPKEEVVKFINRFIRKKTSFTKYIDILQTGENLKALDFGCGIGRMTVLLHEFNIDGYGIDISENAISEAKKFANYFNFNLNDNTVPGDERFGLTTSYSLIMNDIADGSTVYLKFYLDAPAGQAPGTYSNFVSFEAVPAGNPPP